MAAPSEEKRVKFTAYHTMGIEHQLKKVKIPGLSALALCACLTFLKVESSLSDPSFNEK